MTTDPTQADTREEAFRLGWKQADKEGKKGKRVAAGLAAADGWEERQGWAGPLSFSYYQDATQSTAIYPEAGTGSILALAYTGLGLGETGEVQGKIKKILRDTDGEITDEQRAAIAAELGDVLWYVARLAAELDYNLGSIAQANLDKLTSRKERGVLKGSGDER